jgi:hypothetical protein
MVLARVADLSAAAPGTEPEGAGVMCAGCAAPSR